MFYAFGFLDGVNTTSGGNGARLRIAGRLVKFPTRATRDAWVSDGYDCCVPRSIGEFRRIVTTRDLPMGWNTKDAALVCRDCGGLADEEDGLCAVCWERRSVRRAFTRRD